MQQQNKTKKLGRLRDIIIGAAFLSVGGAVWLYLAFSPKNYVEIELLSHKDFDLGTHRGIGKKWLEIKKCEPYKITQFVQYSNSIDEVVLFQNGEEINRKRSPGNFDIFTGFVELRTAEPGEYKYKLEAFYYEDNQRKSMEDFARLKVTKELFKGNIGECLKDLKLASNQNAMPLYRYRT